MNNRIDIQNQRRIDGETAALRMTEIQILGTPILAESNLVRQGEITSYDILIARNLLDTIDPVTKNNYSLRDHIFSASRIAELIGTKLKGSNPEKYKNINTTELNILGLTHDFGRCITHRLHRNETLGLMELRSMGVKNEFLSKYPDINKYIGKDPKNQNLIDEIFKSLSYEQRIIEISDILSKRKTDGTFKSFEDVMCYHRESRANYQNVMGKEPIWPSEKAIDENFIRFSEAIYRKIFSWLKEQNISPESIQEEIINQDKNSPIGAFIFDLGGVIALNPERDMISFFSNTLNSPPTIIKDLWDKNIENFQTGEIDENEFLKKFIDTQTSSQENLKRIMAQGLTPERNLGLLETVRELKERGFITAIHSDTVYPHIEYFRSHKYYDDFHYIILSPDIMITKRHPEAFIIAALKLWIPIQSIVFIDDKQENIKAFTLAGGKFGILYESNTQVASEIQKII